MVNTGHSLLEAAGLGGLAAVAGAGSSRAAPEPSIDRELLAAVDRYARAHDKLRALVRLQAVQYGPSVPAEAFELQGQLCDLLLDRAEDVRDIPARTIEGLRAKGRALHLEECDLPGHEPDTLMHSLLRDLRDLDLHNLAGAPL